jgi:hypothetical protein
MGFLMAMQYTWQLVFSWNPYPSALNAFEFIKIIFPSLMEDIIQLT